MRHNHKNTKVPVTVVHPNRQANIVNADLGGSRNPKGVKHSNVTVHAISGKGIRTTPKRK